jgi:DNA-binding LytR/AlgR family response regulator
MFCLAICDDRQDHIIIIKTAVEHYVAERSLDISVDVFDNPFIFLESLSESGGYDIVLLDICMPGILGTEVAREIRNRKDNTEIVFLTTSTDFSVEAFALRAAHYLVKPFLQIQFDEAMDRVIEKLCHSQVKPITLRVRNGGVQIVDISEIVYIESLTHSQIVHLKSTEWLEARQSLSEFAKSLEQSSKGQFVSPYKGYIVNLRYIRTIESQQIVMCSGQRIPIAKRSFRGLRERYFDYIFEGSSGK